MFPIFKTDIREQKAMKWEYRHLWLNTVNDLRYEIKFENRMKNKNHFFIKWNISFFKKKKQKYILFLKLFFKISKNLIASAFFLPRQILKIIDIPWQKPWHLPTAEASLMLSGWSRILCFKLSHSFSQFHQGCWNVYFVMSI